MKIAVTGANSSVGKALLGQLAEQGHQVSAAVRSSKAFSDLPQSELITPCTIDYQQADTLLAALEGCDTVIHLAGILIESKHSNYATANIAATDAVVAAARASGIKHIVFISVVNASADSRNAYLRSKGCGEVAVQNSGITATVLRTPMLLGPGTAGASSLLGTASGATAKVLGGGEYTMRPLDVDDLCKAIIAACQNPEAHNCIRELVGPQGITFKGLVEKTAALQGREISVGSIPIWSAKLFAALGSIVKGGGISPTVIDVITSDEKVETNADQALGITLTPLDTTLQKIITAQSS
jgi:NADH dehydrogenase